MIERTELNDLAEEACWDARLSMQAAIEAVCMELGINRTTGNWHEQLAPFAPVIAAQIAAAAQIHMVLIGELYPTERNAHRREEGL